MSSTRTRRSVVACTVAAAVLGSSLAGCSITRDEDPKDQENATSSEPSTTPSDDAASPTASASASPTASATPSVTPAATPSPTPARTKAATPQQAILTAAQMPRLNRSSPWTEQRTDVASGRPFGLCQEFDLLSIGAMSVVERTFAFEDDTAGQQVAEFADTQTLRRASKVLEAWHGRCADKVRGTSVKVRPITEVPVTNGTAWTYLVSYERGGEGHFHSLGMVASGTRLTLIRIDHGGQDHNYPRGKEPTELAVKAASAKMG